MIKSHLQIHLPRSWTWVGRYPSRKIPAYLGIYLSYIVFIVYLGASRFHAVSLHNSFDTSVFAQSLWWTIRGGFFTNTVEAFMANLDSASHFAFHWQPILFCYLPFYYFFETPAILFIVSVLLLPLGGVFVFLLARLYTRDEIVPLLLMLIFWMHPAFLHNILDARPEGFALLFIPASLYFFESGSRPAAWTSLVLLTMCKESMFVVTAFFGIYLMIRHRAFISGIVCFVISIFLFILITHYVIPSFRGSAYQYFDRYSQWGNGVGSIFLSMLTHPLEVFSFVLNREKIWYLLQVLVPFFFIPLLSPSTLLIAVPIFAQNLLSGSTFPVQTIGRTATTVTAVLACSCAMALPKLQGWVRGELRLRWVFLCMLIFSTAICGAGPMWTDFRISVAPDKELIQEIEDVEGLISPTETVCAHFDLLYLYCQRPAVYVFPIHMLKASKVLIVKDKPEWPAGKYFPAFVQKLKDSKGYRVIYEGKRLLLWDKKQPLTKPVRGS